jgi:hypothetical protein
MSISVGKRPNANRELIVVLKPDAVVAPGAVGTSSTIRPILDRYQARLEPISASPSFSPAAEPALANQALSRLAHFQHVVASDRDLDALRSDLAKEPSVEAAYIKPGGRPPAIGFGASNVPTARAITPDFTPRQGYLGSAPSGVDALYAWGIRGGTGTGVRIIDCEWAWNFTHEDLVTHCDGAVVGTPSSSDDDHGTAVVGTIIGNANGFGITGIAPDATVSTACFSEDSSSPSTSKIILAAANKLSAGDILLLEIHRPGPKSIDGQQDQFGYIPIEWWRDDFLAISYATAKGVIVVEAAGNGSQNLDDSVYSNPLEGFPPDWANPFGNKGPDSRAIVVGAGNPPSGTHGRAQDSIGFNELYVDRARCVFSNYGSRIDCQGWGWEVTTLGIGDLESVLSGGSPAPDHNRMYTDTFDGTSSASPIVTGVLACAQGALRAASKPLLTPTSGRQILRETGSPQQSAPNRPSVQHIGPRPDLKAILKVLAFKDPTLTVV